MMDSSDGFAGVGVKLFKLHAKPREPEFPMKQDSLRGLPEKVASRIRIQNLRFAQ
jgi:hypothetical protein